MAASSSYASLLALGAFSFLLHDAAARPLDKEETFTGPYHVEANRAREITFTYKISAETPDDRVEKWVVNLPEPPITDSQKVDKVEFTITGFAAKWTKKQEGSPLKRPLRTVVVGKDGGAHGKITITANYKATMFERRLVAGKSPVVVPKLSDEEVKAWTAATPTCDYLDAGVQAWIDKHGLTKTKDETTLRFASRVFHAVQKHLRYEAPTGEADFFRCSRTVKTAKADCGRPTSCSVLRCGTAASRREYSAAGW